MAMAVSIVAIQVLGGAISPPIIGWLADVSGLARAVLVVPLAIVAAGAFWIATALVSSSESRQGVR
jgi:fucose permease